MLESKTLAHSIADDLRRLIETGHYPPGAALRQEEIAARLGVSRIPVRDALRVLEANGLVAVQANRGAFVTEHDVLTIDELFDVRLMIESDLLRRACLNLSEELLRRLGLINAALVAMRSPEDWIRGDEEFHFTIYEAARRPQTLALARTLRRSLNSYYLLYLGPQVRSEQWDREHRDLLRWLRRGEPEKAVLHLQRHLRATRKALIDALSQRKKKGAGRV